ncbi:aldo/keto reductase [Streptomyces pseudovenezuelae]|uniref:aldo/keto reductase n=1 Tax=Streptomyces pseudovenezuelae TaxID=67350 RepID=UPI002E342EC9|nr:aldo/keto reductase [Streptomyces pseudovenezuelae]
MVGGQGRFGPTLEDRLGLRRPRGEARGGAPRCRPGAPRPREAADAVGQGARRHRHEDVLPTVRRHGMGTLTYSPLSGGWLSGRYRKNATEGPASAARPQARFDMNTPANQRKLDVVEQLAVLAEKAGMSPIELAVAFVIHHPGVTSAIIGPRTVEQLKAFLPAADISLPSDLLDAIDEIVAPGVTVNNNYGDFELRADQRRH